MSIPGIPGLGQIAPVDAPSQAAAAASAAGASQIQDLQPFWEYRFEVPHGSELTIKLVSGTAEKDGTELAPGNAYSFTATKSKINTWHGCSLEVACPKGSFDAYTAEPSAADQTPSVSHVNLHFKLEGLRSAAASRHARGNTDAMGPRVLVVGPPNSGKTSLVRTLTGWATRMDRQPLVVSTDPSEGMLALPGTLSAAVFATLMDITTEWGSTPTSGPSPIPVKLPLSYYYGLEHPEDNAKLYKRVCSSLSVSATARLTEDPEVRAAGMLIDTTGIANPGAAKDGSAYDALAHIVAEFSINIIVVLGSERMTSDLQKRFGSHRTTLDEEVTVVGLDKSGGVVERDATFMQQVREAAIREYFFGDARNTLSPFTQQVDFAALSLWRINEGSLNDDNDNGGQQHHHTTMTPASDDTVQRVEPSLMMQNCTLAVMYASVHDPPDTIRDANVMGFVYVADVDEKRKKLKILAPVSARLGDRPLLWGSWPEPMVSLLG
ncbi:Pre-mRNA cleavage complex II protein Clp1-domain-containing protein [Microdochium trichocladiopsis]|uniref:Polynucleotide 5'-hydroxyl-kinase GRC3 n=1 Tax=Microdochium trichocladiopsis TaxID=1682393 RepID=A0A9P9BUG0_9PEZI|nr:Pre-mRNA cleavage complex II protein Clp1-domain-containing protein [Microdochium trichocladiopsis]KAH7031414.1 Pre-mRNA cleavage complex II protein Clp1-domain-containing protein [Microdochium trichocladiopsis]